MGAYEYVHLTSFEEYNKKKEQLEWLPVAIKWEAVSPGAVRDVAELVSCIIQIDGTFCQLKSFAPPPAWTCVYWPQDGGNYMYFALGSYVDVALPIQRT